MEDVVELLFAALVIAKGFPTAVTWEFWVVMFGTELLEAVLELANRSKPGLKTGAPAR